MELNLSGQQADPFFDVLRRRHPDVDLVILPPDPPPGRHIEPPTEADVVEVAAEVLEATQALWREATGESRVADPIDQRLRYGDRRSDIRAEARVSLGPGESAGSAEAWQRLTQLLPRAGWRTTELPGDLRRIVAQREGLRAAVSFAERTGVLSLTVTSLPMSGGVEQARALVRAGDR